MVIQNYSVDEKLLQGMKVLVIDNDPQVLVATAGLLTDWGAQTFTAADIKQAKMQPPCELILADYHLDDGHTGIELVWAMRKAWSADTPAIINSADPDEQLREQALEANAYFIPKPLKSGALKRLLKRIRRV
jgi:DNA-binding response OmpR family regulator